MIIPNIWENNIHGNQTTNQNISSNQVLEEALSGEKPWPSFGFPEISGASTFREAIISHHLCQSSGLVITASQRLSPEGCGCIWEKREQNHTKHLSSSCLWDKFLPRNLIMIKSACLDPKTQKKTHRALRKKSMGGQHGCTGYTTIFAPATAPLRLRDGID